MTRKRSGVWKAALVVAVFAGGGIYIANQEEPVTGPPCSITIGTETVGLTVEQARHATTISAAASRLAMPNRAVTVAYATVWQESKFVNVDYGDRDSVGLFQQRPSQGWGSVEEIMRPSYSATQFFVHLARIDGWANMSVNDAAQAVQRSGFPDAYAQWETQSRLMARSSTGEEPATFTCRVDVERRSDAEEALAGDLSREAGVPGIGEPAKVQRGWMMASWLIARAEEYGIASVAFNGQRWTAESGQWESITNVEQIVRVNY